MKSYIQNITSYVLALIMLVFGLNKFIGFIPVEPPSDPVAQQFLGTMFTTYLYALVALAEIVGAVLLIAPRTRFLGWLILLPVLVGVLGFHVAHDFIGNGIWLIPVALFVLLGVSFRSRISAVIALQS